MSLQYSEYNPSDDNSDKKPVNKRGVTRKKRCKIRSNKIQNLLKSVEGMDNESGNLADFNPPPKPELTQMGDREKDTPKSESVEQDLDSPVQPHDYQTFNNEAVNNEYYQQYIPYYTQLANQQAVNGDKSQLLEKLNYMIALMEEQKEHKTDNITEELILYMFLGVFVIFVVDSFARAGKYTR